jgi:hypothetical protein
MVDSEAENIIDLNGYEISIHERTASHSAMVLRGEPLAGKTAQIIDILLISVTLIDLPSRLDSPILELAPEGELGSFKSFDKFRTGKEEEHWKLTSASGRGYFRCSRIVVYQHSFRTLQPVLCASLYRLSPVAKVLYPPSIASDVPRIKPEDLDSRLVPFRHRFAPPIEGILTPGDALERLTDVSKSEDKVALQTILDIASVVGLPSEASTILGFLLRQTWHRSHRDIAVLLKLFNDPRTIEDLKEAAANPLWYSDCSSFCVYILSQIGSKEAVHAIEDLAVSPNGRVRGDAIRTLMKLRKPGEPE